MYSALVIFSIGAFLLCASIEPQQIVSAERALVFGYPSEALQYLADPGRGVGSSDIRREVEMRLGKEPLEGDQDSYWEGLYWMKRQEYERALKVWQKRSQVKDEEYINSVFHNLSKTYLALGRFDEALEGVEQSLRREGGADAYEKLLLKAEILFQLHRYEEARELLLTYEPHKESDRRYDLLAKIAHAQGSEDLARKYLMGAALEGGTRRGRWRLSLMAQLSEGEVAMGYMKQVMEQMDTTDSVFQYCEQYIKIVRSNPSSKGSAREDLKILDGVKGDWFAAFYAYIEARLQEDTTQELKALERVYKDNSLGRVIRRQACLLAAHRMSGLPFTGSQAREFSDLAEWTQRDEEASILYGYAAERASVGDKAYYYQKALKRAPAGGQEDLKYNYTLAHFYNGTKPYESYVLATDHQQDLLLAKALATRFKDPTRSRAWLEEFLSLDGKHPQEVEVHLVLAEILLESQDKTTQLLSANHLNTIHKRHLDALTESGRYHEACIRLALVRGDKKGLKGMTHPSKYNPEHRVRIGHLLYTNGRYGAAKRLFQSVLEEESITSQEKEIARFYFSLCLLKLKNNIYEKEAIDTLEGIVADSQSVFEEEAGAVLAELYINVGQYRKALFHLARLPSTAHRELVKVRALSLARAPEYTKRAHKQYAKLVREKGYPVLKRYQIVQSYCKFLVERGATADLLELSSQLIYNELLPFPVSEEGWGIYKTVCHYAIDLLLEKRRWLSATALAKVLGDGGSPHSEYFRALKDQLTLKYIIWDESEEGD